MREGIHPYTPVMIVMLFLLGVGSSVSHHFYYSSLHDTAAGGADRQQWVIQIGTGLAFLSNAALVSVIGISRTQWVWTTLRKRFITVGGIDALFGVTLDPTYFGNLDMVRRAKLATFMAVMVWVAPLAAILTPGTISVHTIAQVHSVPCNVRTLAFEFDTDSTALKLCCEDETLVTTSAGSYVKRQIGIPGFVGRVLTLAALSGHVQIPTTVGSSTPGSHPDTTLMHHCGENCTYAVTFLGPGIRCTENTDWTFSTLVPGTAMEFMGKASFRADMVTEGVLWAGYIPNGEDTEPHVLFCRRSVARYRVRHQVTNYQFREPTLEAYETLYIIPDLAPQYPETVYLPNQAVFYTIWKVLNGNLSSQNDFRASDIALTPLSEDLINRPSQLGPNIERMAQTMVVSMLSIDTAGSNESYPLFQHAALERNNCEATKAATVYEYKRHRLFQVYGTSVTLTLLMAVVGFVALIRNGVSSSVRVSAILRTTRNPTLDRLLGGSCLGADPMPREVAQLRLKFGELRSGGGTVGEIGHLALGVEGEVFPVRDGARYA